MVVVVLLLVELVTLSVLPGEAPMELVLPVEPVVAGVPLVPAVLDVSLLVGGGAGVVDTLFSVVVLVVLDVVGVVASRLVQAPRDTAATSARAAHEVRDAFIGNSLRGCCVGFERALHRPTAHSRHALPPVCRPQPQISVGQT